MEEEIPTRGTKTVDVTPKVETPKDDPWASFANRSNDGGSSTPSAPASYEDKLQDLPNNIVEATNKAGEELLAFVDTQIQRMSKKVQFSGGGNITLYELDVALSTYEPTLFALTALYEQAKFDADTAKAIYDEWYYDKYMEIRNTYNTINVKNSQWLSAKEIEATLFKMYKQEAAKLKADVIKCEGERSTIERLLKGWENYAFILGQLSKNVNAQMMGSNMHVDMRRGDDF